MKIQISKINKVPTQYGYDLNISMVKLLNDDGGYNKFVKLNDELIAILLSNQIDDESHII